MASPSQVRDGSTSQMCLHKILRIITTVPPPLSSSESSSYDTVKDSKNGNKGSGLLLNESNYKNEEANYKSFSLLIEAARLIFGEFEDEAENYEETLSLSPVVRSKRGRIQVLPYKYRDSVIEPLTKRTRR